MKYKAICRIGNIKIKGYVDYYNHDSYWFYYEESPRPLLVSAIQIIILIKNTI